MWPFKRKQKIIDEELYDQAVYIVNSMIRSGNDYYYLRYTVDTRLEYSSENGFGGRSVKYVVKLIYDELCYIKEHYEEMLRKNEMEAKRRQERQLRDLEELDNVRRNK